MTNSIPLGDLESSPSAKFERIGDSVNGRITSMNERQQTDIQGNAMWWDVERTQPRMLWVITLEQANGEYVALWAKGGNFKPRTGSGTSMLAAIGAAVKAAGASSIDVGGELAVAYTGDTEAQLGKNAGKCYTAQYRPPAAQPKSVDADLFTS